jgi:hypothetical protein
MMFGQIIIPFYFEKFVGTIIEAIKSKRIIGPMKTQDCSKTFLHVHAPFIIIM